LGGGVMAGPTSKYFEPLAARVSELERILVLKGFRRAATRQARAINLICENLETLQEIIEQHQSATNLPKA
jgi:hypothetical protein